MQAEKALARVARKFRVGGVSKSNTPDAGVTKKLRVVR